MTLKEIEENFKMISDQRDWVPGSYYLTDVGWLIARVKELDQLHSKAMSKQILAETRVRQLEKAGGKSHPG